MNLERDRVLQWLYPLTLSIVVLFDLLKPGYIILLDRAVGPNPSTDALFGLTTVNGPNAAVNGVALAFTQVAPYWVFQKILLLAIFTAMGAGVYRLLEDRWFPGRLFAATLYVVNPFTYIRFMSGQFGVLAAYAALPFAVKQFHSFLEKPSTENAVKVALLTFLVGAMQSHGFFIAAVPYLGLLAVKTWRDPGSVKALIRPGAVIAVLFTGLNLYWVAPLLLQGSTALSVVGGTDLAFYEPVGISSLGVVFDVAAMYGFWRTPSYPIPAGINPYALSLFPILLFFAVHGYTKSRTEEKNKIFPVAIAVTALFAFILAVGNSSHYTRPLFLTLWENVPMFKAFRDSHKFVGLIVLGYAYLGGIGANQVLESVKKRLSTHKERNQRIAVLGLTALLIATPLVYTFTMHLGFQNHVETTQYPGEWHEVNTFLEKNADDSQALFLPWHLYMNYHWLPNTDKRAGPIAKRFFSTPMVTGDNVEIPRVYSRSPRPTSRYVQNALGLGPGNENRDVSNLGELLVPLNVKYVLVTKEVDWKRYDSFLQKQSDLELVLENEMFKVYRNRFEVSRSYGVDEVRYVSGIDDFVNRSQVEDVTQAAYVVDSNRSGEAVSPKKTNGRVNLQTEKINPAKYRVQGTGKAFTVFTQRQDTSYPHWSLNGEGERYLMLGMAPVFNSVETGKPGKIMYTKFYNLYLPTYIISLLTLSAILLHLYIRREKKP